MKWRYLPSARKTARIKATIFVNQARTRMSAREGDYCSVCESNDPSRAPSWHRSVFVDAIKIRRPLRYSISGPLKAGNA